jgi:hypothetical protein
VKDVYANAVAKTAFLDSTGNIMNSESLFPGCYRVETYMGDDNLMRYVVYESEEEYIWDKLSN